MPPHGIPPMGHMISSLASARGERPQLLQQQQLIGGVIVVVGLTTTHPVVVGVGVSLVNVTVGLLIREVMSVDLSCWAAANAARPQLSMVLQTFIVVDRFRFVVDCQ